MRNAIFIPDAISTHLTNETSLYPACTTRYNGTCLHAHSNSSQFQPDTYYYTEHTPLLVDANNAITLFHSTKTYLYTLGFIQIMSIFSTCSIRAIVERASFWLPITSATLLFANAITTNPQEYDTDIKFWSNLLIATSALARFGLNLSLDRKLASLSRQHQVSCFPITHINKCLCPSSAIDRQVRRVLNPIRETDERESATTNHSELAIGLPIYEDAPDAINPNGAAAGPAGIAMAINPIRQRNAEQTRSQPDRTDQRLAVAV